MINSYEKGQECIFLRWVEEMWIKFNYQGGTRNFTEHRTKLSLYGNILRLKYEYGLE